MSDVTFKIEGAAKNPTKFIASARQFNLTLDEPPELGGTDEGANPVEFLLAGYAGCLNVVAHLTARELGINIEKLKIEIQGDLNPARFLGESNEERAGFKNIDVQFSPITDASPELVEEWISIIKNRCPINDNLANPTPLSFSIVEEAVVA